MGPGFGAEIARAAWLGFLLLVLVGGGALFGAGYACSSCKVRPHVEWRTK